MATKVLTQIPISTKALSVLRDVGAFLVLCLVGNPVSMFCLNMAFPNLAARFAHNSLFFNEKMCNFYTKLAVKWPYYWAMWWIDKKNLSQYSADEQIEYFFDVDNSESTLFAMSYDAIRSLMYDYPSTFENIARKYNLRDEMFEEVIRRAENNQVIWKDILKQQLHKGTLPKAQILSLSDAAIRESCIGTSAYFEHRLCEYVKRCGLSEFLQHRLERSCASDDFKREVLDYLSQYKQKCSVRFYADLNNKAAQEEWKKYCEENELCCMAQKEMTPKQYTIFHAAGKHMAEDAIAHFLKINNEKMMELIEAYEPRKSIIKAKMKVLDLP